MGSPELMSDSEILSQRECVEFRAELHVEIRDETVADMRCGLPQAPPLSPQACALGTMVVVQCPESWTAHFLWCASIGRLAWAWEARASAGAHVRPQGAFQSATTGQDSSDRRLQRFAEAQVSATSYQASANAFPTRRSSKVAGHLPAA